MASFNVYSIFGPDVYKRQGQRCHAHRLAHAGHAQRPFGDAGIAAKHPTEFEHPHPGGLARQVVAQDPHQAADQAGTHHGQRGGDRIEHTDGIGVAGQILFPTGFDKAEVDGFQVVQARQRATQGVRTASGFRPHPGCHRGQGCRPRQLVVADDANDLFDQVLSLIHI